ncbi:MAG: deoxyhypusine synthase family protein [Candidatus Palauibacterales bacterium]|nr:deoxyhypusine synthase family protein [Candidatus Palauibacterales bacterium]
MSIRDFVDEHYRHFNAATLRDAASGYRELVEGGGRMVVTLAGAMSTAELGISLAEMIRRDRVHAVCCTAANLEEDLFNLVAHDHYRRIPDWRSLTPEMEKDLERSGLNRVTDTCIPEDRAFRVIERPMLELWKEADAAGDRLFPHEFLYRLIRRGTVEDDYDIDPADSWLVAAAEEDLPLFVPGWEDSTLGNIFVAHVIAGDLSGTEIVRDGLEYMGELASWYMETTTGQSLSEMDLSVTPTEPGSMAIPPEEARAPVGFFQIGGGIAGDFPICVVPMLHQDLGVECPYWSYFCQISDSTTSYGSYSGAVPGEKITWGKLDVDTPKYVIESDATIVAPLIFEYVLGDREN